MTVQHNDIIHFIGVGGIGMSGIAQVLASKGYPVSGSDLKTTSITRRLSALGVRICEGHKAENVKDATVVVYSSAVRESNPELQEARKRGLKIMRRAEMLAFVLGWGRSIVISGAHGKTTTTSMVVTTLEAAGMNPTSLIGGELNDIGGNARLGTGEWAVAEGDESDGSLVLLPADVAVVTNIDLEHLDHYPDIASVKACFRQFFKSAKPGARYIVCADSPVALELASEFPRESVLLYGRGENAQYQIRDLEARHDATEFSLTCEANLMGRVRVNVPGVHNASNATAACLAAMQAGLDFEAAADGLARYRGVRRRFEFKGTVGGVTVVDDYGHHPTEITATLATLSGYTQGRRVVIFQPHRYTRTAYLMKDFCTSFQQAKLDWLIVTEVYSAGEDPIPQATGEHLAHEIQKGASFKVSYQPRVPDIAREIVAHINSGDTVLTLGAGDVVKAGETLLSILGGSGNA
ncbi:MAG TPA: UDP-N-acetylmuramate--L-alanine ligase [bacterium]|nr:UDP-N-acetylmuramate--L-alanine ligase [bacterium]